MLLEAARLAEPYCDAVDINIGCPQAIAKRGRYGAFLQDDWNLLQKIGTFSFAFEEKHVKLFILEEAIVIFQP